MALARSFLQASRWRDRAVRPQRVSDIWRGPQRNSALQDVEILYNHHRRCREISSL